MHASGNDVKFGTDGWRAIIAEDYTFDNVARVGAALARYLKSERRKDLSPYTQWGVPCRPSEDGVIVGYDTRFLSREFACHLAQALVAEGVPAQVTDSFVPTPALSHAVLAGGHAGGVIITASHNPAKYNGVKFKPEYGGSATEEVTREVEALLPATPPQLGDTLLEGRDARGPYLEVLEERVDLKAIGEAPLHVVADAMYGSAQGYWQRLLHGVRLPLTPIRSTVDPLFGGRRPEPLEENLVPLRAVIRSLRRRSRQRIVVGLVTDGDGDRAAAMDENGAFVDTHRAAALILWHLIRHRGLKGPVIKSFALTDMVSALAADAGLECREVKIGFKWAVEGLVRGDVEFAGEESGGYGYSWHLPERDGLLSGLLLLELVAATGKSLSALVDELFERVGPHHYRRMDLGLSNRLEIEERLRARPPEELGGRRVEEVETLDGLKLRLQGGWVLFRASGTEPILRIYCEMDSPGAVNACLEDAKGLVTGGLAL
ncbi:MAG: phosphoglucomutase/phosphomannomutase family protein [Candidatus Bipolaricaulota bacterium]